MKYKHARHTGTLLERLTVDRRVNQFLVENREGGWRKARKNSVVNKFVNTTC